MRRISCALVALALCASSAAARAAEDDPRVRSAEALFEEAKALMSKGDAASACPKFEQSQALDPGAGTQFFLADCYEATGRVAKAYALFHDLEGVLVRVNDPRAKLAGERARKVEPRVPKLTVRIAWANSATDLVVVRDDRPIDASEIGQPANVEMGKHVFEVRASGRRSWKKEVSIAEGQSMSLDVPELALEDVVAPVDRPQKSARKTIGIVTGIVGLAALGTGAVLLGVAKGNYDSAISGCTKDASTYRCGNDADAKTRGDRATSLANVGTVVAIVGVAAVAGGVVLWLTAPKTDRRAFIAPSLGGVVLGGAF